MTAEYRITNFDSGKMVIIVLQVFPYFCLFTTRLGVTFLIDTILEQESIVGSSHSYLYQ